MSSKGVSKNLQAWIDARKQHRLSDAHVQMAWELGLDPMKLGKIDNHKQEPWKAPLAQFIEACYMKRFGKARPDAVLSVEARFRLEEAKKAARRAAKRSAQNVHSESATVPLEREADDPARCLPKYLADAIERASPDGVVEMTGGCGSLTTE